jgi:hypothetical protein
MGPLETEVMTILSDEVSGSRFALEPEGFGRDDFLTAFRALTPEERDDQFLLSLAGLARAVQLVARAVDGRGASGTAETAAD